MPPQELRVPKRQEPPTSHEYRALAAEMLAAADATTHPQSRHVMLEIAGGYQRLAEFAEKREAEASKK
jgi:hypothetical protein